MTPTKIKRKLNELRDKIGDQAECWIFHDEWADDKPVREIITLGSVISQYEDKSSVYYRILSITSNYLEFEKRLLANKPIHEDKFYEDSYIAYMKAWQEQHPGEDYEEWARTQRRNSFHNLQRIYKKYYEHILRTYV